MSKYRLAQNQNKSNKEAYLKWYAVPVIEHTVDLEELAEHMVEHNSAYSIGLVRGVLTDMVSCTRELVLDGKHVKIDDLAIFYPRIVNKKGADTKKDFVASECIEGVRLGARATGELSKKSINIDTEITHDPLDTYDTVLDEDGEDEDEELKNVIG
jgi:predicted histone-like DNA-binding protein